ncbi:hypothetical protein NLJ89_g9387 [Agrocybe chaxingu]|uniref:Protein kinase domain-containing protein n=1 Tax=Agrocybe chaxingu TaxID=84603 RepID=A0A9W8K027_9AGAR|nr:hypothetical protein NLJ89_g9387 [Agrocybe chaxingu]
MAADDARTGTEISKPVHQDITAISTISIHGLTLSDTNVSLSRAESFPSFQYDDCEPRICDDPSWDPLPIPQNLAHLELRLTDRINEGRIGLVYGVDVVGSRDRALKLPRKLCVKIFKPNSARTAAREYWFYEQLARSGRRPGAVAARCFGFFTASLSDLVDENGQQLTADRILPWEEALIDDRGWPYSENPVKRAARKAALATERDILFGDDEFYWKSEEGDTFTGRPSPWAR